MDLHSAPSRSRATSAATGKPKHQVVVHHQGGQELRRLQKLPAIVRGFFLDPNLAYITASVNLLMNAW